MTQWKVVDVNEISEGAKKAILANGGSIELKESYDTVAYGEVSLYRVRFPYVEELEYDAGDRWAPPTGYYRLPSSEVLYVNYGNGHSLAKISLSKRYS